MRAEDFERSIDLRLRHAGREIDRHRVSLLAGYLALLARWNRRINLTAFDLDRPSDHAIDRLIVEPVVAGGEVAGRDRVVVDIGSGGGSPALPLKILVPRVQMTLVEARVRKTAFLREAVRELGLEDVRIETVRLGRRGLSSVRGAADVVTIRAVRMDSDVLDGVAKLLAPEGRMFWFGAEGHPPDGWLDVPVRDASARFLRIMAPGKVK